MVISMSDWKWRVDAYYKEPPHLLAYSVSLANDWLKDLEVEVFNGRKDIGNVVVTQIGCFDEPVKSDPSYIRHHL